MNAKSILASICRDSVFKQRPIKMLKVLHNVLLASESRPMILNSLSQKPVALALLRVEGESTQGPFTRCCFWGCSVPVLNRNIILVHLVFEGTQLCDLLLFALLAAIVPWVKNGCFAIPTTPLTPLKNMTRPSWALHINLLSVAYGKRPGNGSRLLLINPAQRPA